ncbi:MAG: helix-turn-helix domain-containing protein [Holophaga sp.]|jgi:excisionase family DNA binding protein
MKKQQTITIPIPDVPSPIPKLAFTVEEAAEALNIGKTSTYAMIEEGRLRVVRLGRKILIPVTELQAFLDREMGSAKGFDSVG